MDSYQAVIAQWPSIHELASDIGKSAEAVRKWNERDWIPAEHWPEVIESSQRRKYRVSFQLLSSLRKVKGKNARV